MVYSLVGVEVQVGQHVFGEGGEDAHLVRIARQTE